MMKQMKRLAVAAALLGAGALAAPSWADQEVTCPQGSQCWQFQTPGSVFDCVVRRGGKAFVTGKGLPYCADIPSLPGSGGNKRCWTDPDNRGGGNLCHVLFPGYSSPIGAFVDMDNNCAAFEGEAHGKFVAVHPDINKGYSVFGQKNTWFTNNCRREEDAIPLKGDLRPDPLSFNPLSCGPGKRLAPLHDVNGNLVASCERAKEGDARLNGLPMGLKVWHPNASLNHMIEVERQCPGGAIPIAAKIVGAARRKDTCHCPEGSHKWLVVSGTRYCVATEDGNHHLRRAGPAWAIPGWKKWEQEMKGMLANVAAGRHPYYDPNSEKEEECGPAAIRDAGPSTGGDSRSNRRLAASARSDRHYKRVCELLRDGADPNYRTRGGAAPLHRAVSAKAEGNIRLLLAAGADLNAQDDKGMTPLDMAAEKGLRDIAASLKEAGGTCNVLSGELCE